MSKILKVSESNYRLQVQSGGTITLDTGANTPVAPSGWIGGVIITGDLLVMGNTTTVDTANLDIEDNIIRLNKNEGGSGITAGTSGLEIDRGTLDNAQFLFDESLQHWDQTLNGGRGTGTGGDDQDGTFVLKTLDGTLSSVKVAGIVAPDNLDLTFDLRNSPYALRIANADATSYSGRLFDGLNLTEDNDNLIPNRKFITEYVSASGLTTGMADVDKIYKTNGLPPVAGGIIQSEVLATANPNIQFFVRSGAPSALNQRAEINSNGLFVDNVQTFGSLIQTKAASSATLLLRGDSGHVEVDSVFNLTDRVSIPVAVTGKNRVYSRAIAGPGKTGLFFTNTTTSDELVAKNRALLFSMLF